MLPRGGFRSVDAVHPAAVTRALNALVVCCGLTPREREVVEGCMRGGTRVEIQERLGISESTYASHATSIRRKTGRTVANLALAIWNEAADAARTFDHREPGSGLVAKAFPESDDESTSLELDTDPSSSGDRAEGT